MIHVIHIVHRAFFVGNLRYGYFVLQFHVAICCHCCPYQCFFFYTKIIFNHHAGGEGDSENYPPHISALGTRALLYSHSYSSVFQTLDMTQLKFNSLDHYITSPISYIIHLGFLRKYQLNSLLKTMSESDLRFFIRSLCNYKIIAFMVTLRQNNRFFIHSFLRNVCIINIFAPPFLFADI